MTLENIKHYPINLTTFYRMASGAVQDGDEESNLPSRLEALELKEEDEHGIKKQILSPEEKKKRDLWEK